MEANKNYINVVESVPDDAQIDIVENDAVNLILKAFNEDKSEKNIV